ncbi:MAG: hypothetical protein IJK73_02995 [Bacteroidales bacterium]|nr:hypothetical protein [Bacteroidales bacterium]
MKKDSLKQDSYISPMAEIIVLKTEGRILQESNLEDPTNPGGDNDW